MPDEHKSYLAEKIILHSALLCVSFLINSIPVISVFMIMWLIHHCAKIPTLLANGSIDMIIMLPISSLCTDFFIIKTIVMYNRGIIKNEFLYFMKLFLIYYICLTIFTGLTSVIVIENATFQKLTLLKKFFLHNSINYSVVLIFIIIYYLKNKEYFRIQNFLME